MAPAAGTLESYFSDYQSWLINPLHVSKLIRLCLERLLELYIEQFLYSAQRFFGIIKGFWPKHIAIDLSQPKENKGKKDKKKSEAHNSHLVINDKETLVENLTKDADDLRDVMAKKFGENLGGQYVDKFESAFSVWKELLRIQRSDFDILLVRVHETFKGYGLYLLEVTLTIREEDPAFIQEILAHYEERFKEVKENKN